MLGAYGAIVLSGQKATDIRAPGKTLLNDGEICPALSTQAIEWEQEAALVTFNLDPIFLADDAHEVSRGASGELAWVEWREETSLPPLPCTPRYWYMLPTHRSKRIVSLLCPYLNAHDPLF